MALSKAIHFVQRFGHDTELRSHCNSFDTKGELLKEMDFNEYELEDAINMNLVKCQTYEEAEVFQQIKMWFALF